MAPSWRKSSKCEQFWRYRYCTYSTVQNFFRNLIRPWWTGSLDIFKYVFNCPRIRSEIQYKVDHELTGRTESWEPQHSFTDLKTEGLFWIAFNLSSILKEAKRAVCESRVIESGPGVWWQKIDEKKGTDLNLFLNKNCNLLIPRPP